jgi:hypothetical protein
MPGKTVFLKILIIKKEKIMRSQNYRSRSRYGSRGNSNKEKTDNRNYNYGRSRSFGSNSDDDKRYGRYTYDEPYGEDYDYSDSYQRNTDDYNRGYFGNQRNHNNKDSRNMFERAGERMKDKWNDWTDNDDNVYSQRYRSRHSYGNGNGRDNGENIFNKAGRKIRETWDDWTDRDDYDNRRRNDGNDSRSYYGRSYGYGGNNNDHRDGNWNRWFNGEGNNQGDYAHKSRNNHNNHSSERRYPGNRNHSDHDRNFFERAADKIKEKWNDWTDNDEQDNEYRYRSQGRKRNANTKGYSNRNYRHNWKNRNKQHSNW